MREGAAGREVQAAKEAARVLGACLEHRSPRVAAIGGQTLAKSFRYRHSRLARQLRVRTAAQQLTKLIAEPRAAGLRRDVRPFPCASAVTSADFAQQRPAQRQQPGHARRLVAWQQRSRRRTARV